MTDVFYRLTNYEKLLRAERTQIFEHAMVRGVKGEFAGVEGIAIPEVDGYVLIHTNEEEWVVSEEQYNEEFKVINYIYRDK